MLVSAGMGVVAENGFRSAIIFPQEKQVVVHDGKVEVRGWAYSGNASWIERVEVSSDGYAHASSLKSTLLTYATTYSIHFIRGHTWYETHQDEMTEKHYHAWRLWTIKLPLDAEGWIELCVRAWDSSNNTQPTYVRSAWKCVDPLSLLLLRDLTMSCTFL